jgi:mannose-1-phosphate guanylyltransferase
MAKVPKNTRAVIFAGGIGTRMWPLSRQSTPKQFERIIGTKSTLQLAVDRIKDVFGYNNIFISTGKRYIPVVKKQLPEIPVKNVIGEPEMRDVGPAVGYLMSILAKDDPTAPVAILWSDHIMRNEDKFREILLIGSIYIKKHPNVFLLIGQKPRFASQNLGWIESGKEIEKINSLSIHEFKSWHYRPDMDTAKRYFSDNKYSWNPGYFIVTPRFVFEQFEKHAPDLYSGLKQLQKSYGTSRHAKDLKQIYPKFEKISFDNAIMEKIDQHQAVVVSADLGWSDVGAWEALKEVLQTKEGENVVKGNVVLRNTNDSLVYSYTDQLVTAIDLEGMVVVITPDVILICPQNSIPEVKKQLKEFEGTELEKFS